VTPRSRRHSGRDSVPWWLCTEREPRSLGASPRGEQPARVKPRAGSPSYDSDGAEF
jgi:hypothetical protein